MKTKTAESVLLAGLLLMASFAFAGPVTVETPSDQALARLVRAWNEADVDTTDKYTLNVSVPDMNRYKSRASLLEAVTEVERLDAEEVEIRGTADQTAFVTARDLFTADPYRDNESLRDIGPVVEALSALLRSRDHVVLTASVVGDFHTDHFYLIAVSKRTKEVSVLISGYSE